MDSRIAHTICTENDCNHSICSAFLIVSVPEKALKLIKALAVLVKMAIRTLTEHIAYDRAIVSCKEVRYQVKEYMSNYSQSVVGQSDYSKRNH